MNLQLHMDVSNDRTNIIHCSATDQIVVPTKSWASELTLLDRGLSTGWKRFLLADESEDVRIEAGSVSMYIDAPSGWRGGGIAVCDDEPLIRNCGPDAK
jgi:hypothetical protein